jgi:hypothetical protein
MKSPLQIVINRMGVLPNPKSNKEVVADRCRDVQKPVVLGDLVIAAPGDGRGPRVGQHARMEGHAAGL